MQNDVSLHNTNFICIVDAQKLYVQSKKKATLTLSHCNILHSFVSGHVRTGTIEHKLFVATLVCVKGVFGSKGIHYGFSD